MLTLQVGQGNRILLGAIHLPSFNGICKEQLDTIKSEAARNAAIFDQGGFDGVFIQDQTEGPATFESVAKLSAVTQAVQASASSIALGSQMECDEGPAILSVAGAANCAFVRIKAYVGAMVKSSGIVNGSGQQSIQHKTTHRIETLIFADIFDRCGTPLGDYSFHQALKDAKNLGADAIVLTGKTLEDTITLLQQARKLSSNMPLICGGGVTLENVCEVMPYCEGIIVSSCLKDPDNPGFWSLEKIQNFVEKVRENQ